METLRKLLSTVPDLNRLSRKLLKRKTNLEDLYTIYLFSKQLPKFCKILSRNEDSTTVGRDESEQSHLTELIDSLSDLLEANKLGKFVDLVENVLDFEVVPREFRVCCAHDQSGLLYSLTDKLQSINNKVQREKEQLLEGVLDGLGAKFETERKFVRTYGHHFKIHKRHDNQLKKLPTKQYL